MPRADLSAREALNTMQPYMSALKGKWFPLGLSSAGNLNHSGRIAVGAWKITYGSADEHNVVACWMWSEGHLSFSEEYAPILVAPELPPLIPLGDEWLDSVDVARIVSQAGADKLADKTGFFMSLRPAPDSPLAWEVHANTLEKPGHMTLRIWAVSAITGALLGRIFERRDGQRTVERWTR